MSPVIISEVREHRSSSRVCRGPHTCPLTSSSKQPCIVILNICVSYPQQDCKPFECRLCFLWFFFFIIVCGPKCPAYSGLLNSCCNNDEEEK